jgi:hypothetical protein
LIMKDNFGNTKPVQIELNEWWFNGRIIVKHEDDRLPSWISFKDSESSFEREIHSSKADAVKFALENPFLTPDNLPIDYIGVILN